MNHYAITHNAHQSQQMPLWQRQMPQQRLYSRVLWPVLRAHGFGEPQPPEPLPAPGPGELEAHYRRIIEDASQGILIHRQAILYVNQACAQMFGYDHAADLVGRDFWETLVAPEERAVLQEKAAVRLRDEAVASPQAWRGMRKDHVPIWIESTDSTMLWEGQPAVLAFCTDVTERKRLDRRTYQAQKMQAIGTLAGGIAHEFNNMLQIMLGFADLTQYEVPQGGAAWQNLQTILSTGRRAKDLVQQLLAFSRQREIERTLVDVVPFVQELLPLIRASIPSTITLQYHQIPGAGPVLMDADQIQQVLMHLCANAEYAMRTTGGNLEIEVVPYHVDTAFAASHPSLRPGPHVRIAMRDTGPGIAPQVLGRLFEPFFTTKKVGEGIGMGLAMAEGIVVQHEGTIVVESEPDVGTTCTIYLPQALGDRQETVQVPPENPTEVPCILFVDDEITLAQLGQKMLERQGYTVVSCHSSLEALSLFQATPQRFDLVITDQTMPEMTGEKLAEELRQLRADIPIILCTGFSYSINAEKARALGMNAFLMKPLAMQELAETVRQVLQQASDCGTTADA